MYLRRGKRAGMGVVAEDRLDDEARKRVNKLKGKVSVQRQALGRGANPGGDADEEMMRDLRQWRREAIEILMRAGGGETEE